MYFNRFLVIARPLDPSIALSQGRFRQVRKQEKLRPFCAFLALLAVFGLALGFSIQSRAQDINTVAGGGIPGSAATTVDIPAPTSVVRDASENMYIAAPDSYYIFKVDTTGTLSIFAGTGIQGYQGDGGPAASATLSGPTSLAFDATGNLYFIDLNKVRKIGTTGTISTVAGNGQICPSRLQPCGDGGPATQAQLALPQQVALDSAGNVYIADTSDMRIRRVDTSGNMSTFAGTGIICNGPLFVCGDGGPATSANLDMPSGVIADTLGNLYIADTRDQRVRVVTNGIINNFAGTGKHCPQPTNNCGDGGPALQSNLFNPWGLALDKAQNLYIADELDNRVRKVIVATKQINSVIGSGVQGFSGDGGAPRTAALDQPKGVFADNDGYLVADTGNHRVRQASQGTLDTLAGGGTGGDGDPATAATLAAPNTVAWDNAGNYYIADTANNRIRKVDPSGNISTVVGTGSLGWTGDGGPAASATLNAPTGVVVDASNNIYIGDNGNLVVRKVNASGTITTFAGTGNPCVLPTNPCGDGGPAKLANITSVTSVAVDGDGNLYIADYFDHRIRKVDTSGTITTVAGTGGKGFTGDGGLAVNARLNRPYGVAVNSAGDIFIADSQNNRIRCVVAVHKGCNGTVLKVGSILTYAFNGKKTFAGDGGLAKAASQQDPLEVAIDPSGNLFVSGGADEMVRRIDATTKIVTTVAGDATHPLRAGFAGDGGPATQATLDNIGLAVNASESLLIADTGNNRVRQVDLSTK
jgi:trimeric autotransporter adhesin